MATHTSNNSQATTTRKRNSRAPAGRRSRDEVSLEDVQEDLRIVTRDIAQLKTDAAGAAITGVRHGAESALESVKDATDKAKQAHAQAAEWVSEHPTTSLLLALGAGAIVARLMTRK